MATLGEKIKVLREGRNLTFDALGQAIGADAQALFSLEKRKSRVSKFAPKLAEFFGLDLEVLTDENIALVEAKKSTPIYMGVKHVEQERDSYDRSEGALDDAIELMAIFQQLDARQRDNVLDLARSIVHKSNLRWVRRDGDKP